jgi:hypothetical protein
MVEIGSEILIEDNIYYQKSNDEKGNVFHQIKFKVLKNLVVAINGVNKNFKGFYRIVMKTGNFGFGNELYFQFWVVSKDGKIEDYNINSKYENIEVYFDLNEGIKFIEIALNKFKEILKDPINPQI